MNLFEFKSTAKLTEITTGESLLNYEFHEDEIIIIIIGDRGYISIKGMEYVRKAGADFILRYQKNTFNIYDENGNKIDILSCLNHLKELENTSFTGFYRVKNEYRPVRIIAMRKSKEAGETAVKNMQKTYSRK